MKVTIVLNKKFKYTDKLEKAISGCLRRKEIAQIVYEGQSTISWLDKLDVLAHLAGIRSDMLEKRLIKSHGDLILNWDDEEDEPEVSEDDIRAWY